MRVYRLIQYEGSAADIAEMFRLTINGEYQPGALKITATAVEPQLIESNRMLLHALQQVAGKRWEPPPERLPPSPLLQHPPPGAASSEASDFILQIEGLLSEETSDGKQRYRWAAGMLEGIRETVERSGRVTQGQVAAVSNIENARGLRS